LKGELSELDNGLEFNPTSFIADKVTEIRNTIRSDKAVIACSGGVDSTTCAVLTRRAIGDNLICVFIDTNFMRLGEPRRVYETLISPPFELPLRLVRSQRRFMKALAGLEDAEEKRKAFREAFYSVLSQVAVEEGCSFLVQGTILPDVLETVKGIKTQHNVLEQIKIRPKEAYGFQVIEPLVELYKFQVREVARNLGMPLEATERQPFPGPGLSVRVVGEITPEKLTAEKRVTRVVERKLEALTPNQYFAAILDGVKVAYDKAEKARSAVKGLLKSRMVLVKVEALKTKATGIRGGVRLYGRVVLVEVRDRGRHCINLPAETLDLIQKSVISLDGEASRILHRLTDVERNGRWVVAVRSVETVDFVTASVSDIPWRVLRDTGRLIMNMERGVSAVYYDITPKPPASIEFE
jgi:GMP synthase (glutamine-hydrolysing)